MLFLGVLTRTVFYSLVLSRASKKKCVRVFSLFSLFLSLSLGGVVVPRVVVRFCSRLLLLALLGAHIFVSLYLGF